MKVYVGKKGVVKRDKILIFKKKRNYRDLLFLWRE